MKDIKVLYDNIRYFLSLHDYESICLSRELGTWEVYEINGAWKSSGSEHWAAYVGLTHFLEYHLGRRFPDVWFIIKESGKAKHIFPHEYEDIEMAFIYFTQLNASNMLGKLPFYELEPPKSDSDEDVPF
jgi:hypothetical protein